MKYDYNKLLCLLDGYLADYGGQTLEMSDALWARYEKDELTEEEAQLVFEDNGGDIASLLEYEQSEE